MGEQQGVSRDSLGSFIGSQMQRARLYNGQPYNALNDLTIDTKGRIYFTDTNAGTLSNNGALTIGGMIANYGILNNTGLILIKALLA